MLQFGLAIILSSGFKSAIFTSGTISFLSSCILHAEELSITNIPFSANFGAHSSETVLPAEKIAMSISSFKACSIETTVCL